MRDWNIKLFNIWMIDQMCEILDYNMIEEQLVLNEWIDGNNKWSCLLNGWKVVILFIIISFVSIIVDMLIDIFKNKMKVMKN